MKVICLDCGKNIPLHRKHITTEINYYIEKGLYFCRNCRKKIILKELERLLNDKRRR